MNKTLTEKNIQAAGKSSLKKANSKSKPSKNKAMEDDLMNQMLATNNEEKVFDLNKLGFVDFAGIEELDPS